MRTRHGPKIDFNYCNGCKQCYDLCPDDVFGWDDANNVPTLDYPDECQFCCTCELNCSQLAIDVVYPLYARLELKMLGNEQGAKA